jgi:hypothetical protein
MFNKILLQFTNRNRVSEWVRNGIRFSKFETIKIYNLKKNTLSPLKLVSSLWHLYLQSLKNDIRLPPTTQVSLLTPSLVFLVKDGTHIMYAVREIF